MQLTFVVVRPVLAVALERQRAVVTKPARVAAALPLVLEGQLRVEGGTGRDDGHLAAQFPTSVSGDSCAADKSGRLSSFKSSQQC